MHRMMLLVALLLPASWCPAQFIIQLDPRATSCTLFAGQPPRAVISPMTSEEKAKFQEVYDAVLRDNATLDAEGDALSAKLDTFRNALGNAMVKAHPEVTPWLQEACKDPLNCGHRKEILKAQAEVLQADPFMQRDWDGLTEKMEAHRKAVDAAMVKLDPAVASTLAKYSP